MTETKLTAKQRRFVDEYMVTLNATQSAIEAGYSENTARQQGSRLLTNVDIKDEIERRMDEYAMSANEIIYRLAEQARGDIGDFVHDHASDLAGHPQSYIVKKYKVKRFYPKGNKDNSYEETTELELYDAQSALVHLGKAQGLFKDVHDHTGDLKIEIVYPD